MSLELAVARMQEIHGLLGLRQATPTAARTGGAPAPATTSTTGASPSFQAQLANAVGAPAATPQDAAGAATLGDVPYGDLIAAAARRHGLDPALLAGLIRQESNFNPSASSPAGARGLTQLMPATAASLGVTDASDPAQAIEGGAKYLKQQLDRFGGDVTRALAAYNAGPGAVQRFGGVPPYAETRAYVQKVQAYAEQYRAAVSPASAPSPRPTAVAGGLSYSTV